MYSLYIYKDYEWKLLKNIFDERKAYLLADILTSRGKTIKVVEREPNE